MIKLNTLLAKVEQENSRNWRLYIAEVYWRLDTETTC